MHSVIPTSLLDSGVRGCCSFNVHGLRNCLAILLRHDIIAKDPAVYKEITVSYLTAHESCLNGFAEGKCHLGSLRMGGS
jgi:hypothetical protein